MDDSPQTATFEEVKKRAHAKLKGMSAEQYDLQEVGIALEVEEE